MTKEESFYIGYITKTKGLKGEVQVYFEFEAYEELDLDVLFAEMNGKMVPFFVSAHKLYTNQTGLFYFDDIDHIDKAQPLLKKKLYLPLGKKPEREADELSYEDLEGFMVTDETHGELGKIIAVSEYPQQYVAAVLFREKEILFPLNEEIIVEVDEDERTILVDLPEGLLDIYLNS